MLNNGREKYNKIRNMQASGPTHNQRPILVIKKRKRDDGRHNTIIFLILW